MRTEKQIEASQANGTGAKSQGPTTPEGKATSSRNATTHGLTSRHPLLLNVEQQAALQNHHDAYVTWLKPAGPVETDIVEEMVTIQWRRQRGEAMGATLVQLTMDRMAADVEKQFDNCPHATRIAQAWSTRKKKERPWAISSATRSGSRASSCASTRPCGNSRLTAWRPVGRPIPPSPSLLPSPFRPP